MGNLFNTEYNEIIKIIKMVIIDAMLKPRWL